MDSDVVRDEVEREGGPWASEGEDACHSTGERITGIDSELETNTLLKRLELETCIYMTLEPVMRI